MDVNFVRLEEATRVVIFNQLKDNCDDTLVEKLVSLVGSLHFKAEVTSDQLINLLKAMVTSIEEVDEKEKDQFALSPCFRLIGAILSDAETFESNPVVVGSSLEFLAAKALHVKDSDDYSLLVSYIKCVADIASHSDGNQWVLTTELKSSPSLAFADMAYELITCSRSLFVRNEAEKFLVKILRQSVAWSGPEELPRLKPVITRVLSAPNSDNLNIVKLILGDLHVKRHLNKSYRINEVLVKQFEEVVADTKNSSLVVLFCECLGVSIESQESVETILQKLIKGNHLKGIVSFTSRLLKQNNSFANKWLLYAVYPLIARSERRSELSNEFLASIREKSFVENSTDDKAVMHCLAQMSVHLPGLLNGKQLSILFDSLGILLLESAENTKKRKLTCECLDALDRLGCHPRVGTKELVSHILEVLVDLLPLTTGTIRCEALKSIRKLKEAHNSPNLFKKSVDNRLASQLNAFLKSPTLEDEMDIIDSVLEVITCLSRSDDQFFVSTFPELVDSFWSLWRRFGDEAGYTTFTSSSIPILFALDFELSGERLTLLEIEKHKDIPLLFISFLKGEDSSLKLAVIQVFCDSVNVERISYYEENRADLFYSRVASTLCNLALNDTDSEVQVGSLRLWSSLLDTLFDPICRGIKFKSTVRRLYECGLFDVIYRTLNSDWISKSVKEEAAIIRDKISFEMKDNEYSKEKFVDCLKDASLPSYAFKSRNEDDRGIQLDANKRDQVLDDMFKGHTNQPTLDFIEELNSRQVLSQRADGPEKEEEKEKRVPLEAVSVEELSSFLWDPLPSYTLDVYHLSDFCILDDILAAKDLPNAASVDCY